MTYWKRVRLLYRFFFTGERKWTSLKAEALDVWKTVIQALCGLVALAASPFVIIIKIIRFPLLPLWHARNMNLQYDKVESLVKERKIMPECPRCYSNSQVWRNKLTNKLTCHRAWCHKEIEE